MAGRSAGSVTAAVAVLLTVTLLGGCGGERQAALPPEAPMAATTPAAPRTDSTPPGATGIPEDNTPCPTAGNARPFAKTRFALHAGLALGAFHRYIYKPLRSGGFKEGADKRKRTFAKAAVAGLFTIHELRVARRFAAANPTLCRAVKGVSDRFSALTSKLKRGTATEADLVAGKQAFDGLKSDAAKNGYNFQERNAVVPGAG